MIFDGLREDMISPSARPRMAALTIVLEVIAGVALALIFIDGVLP